MATGGQTPNLGLVKWGPKDPLFYQEWNDNFQKIDDGHNQVTQQLAEKASLTDLADMTLHIEPKNATNIYHKILNGEVTKIVCIGDSITNGVNLDGSQVANPYPKVLQDKLTFLFDNSNVTVVNKGIPGDKASNGLSVFQTNVINENPDLVIIMFGVNDAHQGIDIEVYKSNIKQMIYLAKQNGIAVIVCSPTPSMKAYGGTNTKARLDIASYAKASMEIANAENVDFVNIYDEFKQLFRKNAINNSIFLTDVVHLTEQGYTLIADIIIKEKLCYYFSPKMETGEYTCFNSPYVDFVCGNVFADANNKLGYNFLMRLTTPTDYVKFAVYNDKPNTKLSILNYQNQYSKGFTIKNFGNVHETITITPPGTPSYDVETDVTIGIGLYCFTFYGSDVVDRFYPSGYFLKEI